MRHPSEPLGAIASGRLTGQWIAGPEFHTPADVVAHLGMVQAQDYLAALWAVGLRTHRASVAGVEQTLAARSIVRTWLARGTLHLVAAQDLRWILDLLAPRTVAGRRGRFRQLGLDDAAFARSREAVTAALRGGRQLSRAGTFQVLESAQVSTAGQRGIHILWWLAQDGLICYGTPDGKQQRFALLDEWVPETRTMGRQEALAELARRYFTGHGPATLHDFAWWSGLTLKDARAGLAAASVDLAQQEVAGQTYWLVPVQKPLDHASPGAHLLPAFDEYLVGYRDRNAVLNPVHAKRINAGGGMLSPSIVVDGQVVGTWKRSLKKRSVSITPDWFDPPGHAWQQAYQVAALRYGEFLGLEVEGPNSG